MLEFFLKGLVVLWREGSKKIRSIIVIASTLFILGICIQYLSEILYDVFYIKYSEVIGTMLTALGVSLIIILNVFNKIEGEFDQEKKIKEVERRVQENPQETQASWDLARVKLESYLNRNLSQIRSIFWLTSVVIIGGFILIGYGVYQSFQNVENFNASILTTGSGVLVSFIGGTFLIIYKATMIQAKGYVDILERINAVGMSVQILGNLNEDGGDLKNKTTAEVAKQLLLMYSNDISSIKKN